MTKIAEFKLNKTNSFILNITAIFVFIAGLQLIAFNPYKLFVLVKSHMLLSLSIPLVIVLVHEGMHALAYKIFGAKLKLGCKHFSLYLIDTSGNLFTHKQIAIIMLFPVLCMSLILLVAACIFNNYISFILLSLLLNIAGSTGDILLSIYIILIGRNCWVKDEHNGFSIYKTKIPRSS